MSDLAEIILKTVEHLEKLNDDGSVTKKDVCEDVRNRLCIMMSKVISYPVLTNFAIPLVDVDLSVSDNDEMTAYFESKPP